MKFWLNKFKKTGNVAEIPCSGHSIVISKKATQQLADLVEKDPEATSHTLAEKLKHKEIYVSVRTVRKKLNLIGTTPCLKVYLLKNT